MFLVIFMLVLELLQSTLFLLFEELFNKCVECCCPKEAREPFAVFDDELELKMREKIPVTN